MLFGKRGISGLTSLLIFLTFIIVALGAATLLFYTGNTLQQEGTVAAQQAQKSTSTKLHILSITGEDGRDGDVEIFCEFVKVAPGSAPVRMDKAPIIFETGDIYRSYIAGNRVHGLVVGGGWESLPAELLDIDGDGLDDSIRLIASFVVDQDEHLEIRASSNALDLYRFDLGEDLENAGTVPVQMTMYGSQLTGTGAVSGNTFTIQASVVGKTSVDRALPENDVFIAVSGIEDVPADAGVYSIYNTHDTDGGFNNVIKHNHVSRVCLATEDIQPETNVKMSHIPMYGSSTIPEFNTPDIMTMQKIDLYPWYEG